MLSGTTCGLPRWIGYNALRRIIVLSMAPESTASSYYGNSNQKAPVKIFVGDVYISVLDTDQGCIIGLPAPHFCLEHHPLKSSSAFVLPHASS